MTREIYTHEVKYWTLEQAEAYPFWPPTEGESMATIHTPSGTITSIGSFGVKPTSISWRTDGPTAHVWESVEAATAWMDLVWSLDPKEKARCGWTILSGSQEG